jgi:UDP-N-acetylglucosamine 2-epimerase (non-hydrolysing)
MLGLLMHARLVLTDSGGIQEETTALSVPCLTMRENTERPITVEQGTNTLIARDRARALDCVATILESGGKRGRIPELWDGRAAERIAEDLIGWLGLADPRAKIAAHSEKVFL